MEAKHLQNFLSNPRIYIISYIGFMQVIRADINDFVILDFLASMSAGI